MAVKNLINGKVCDQIEIFDRSLHYGDGLFETIAIQNRKILCIDEHLDRLEKGCKKIKIPVPNKSIIKNVVSSLIDSEAFILLLTVPNGESRQVSSRSKLS